MLGEVIAVHNHSSTAERGVYIYIYSINVYVAASGVSKPGKLQHRSSDKTAEIHGDGPNARSQSQRQGGKQIKN